MPDDLSGLRDSLRHSADAFTPSLDPEALAATSRGRQRRRALLAGVAGVAVFALAAGVGVPALVRSQTVPAEPMAPTQPAPTQSAPVVTPQPTGTVETTPEGFAVDMSDWKTFSSSEYPITFQYPPDWTVDNDLGGDGSDLGKTDGCDTINCVLFVNPPDPDKAAPLELIRNGFAADDSIGGGVADGFHAEPVVSIPDLLVWGSEDDTALRQAVVLRQPDSFDGVDDYVLGTVEPGIQTLLAVGDENPLGTRPEARFLFQTNVGNIGGDYNDDGWKTVVMILGSTRPNPDFNPTRPVEDPSGNEVIEAFDPMETPVFHVVVPDHTWKTITVPNGNLSVRYPADWKAVYTGGGDGAQQQVTAKDGESVTADVIWLTAPSGYIVDILTNGMSEACSAGDLYGSSELLATVDGLQADSVTASGEVQVRWVNGGQYPVWVGLAQQSAAHACFEWYLDFGGKAPVYLASADNGENPTADELDQAIAILLTATRLS